MQILSKAQSALKKIFGDLNRLDLFDKVIKANSRKQKRDTVVFAFKSLASELPKTDMSAIRQLAQLVAQVEDEELRLQLESVMQELFTPKKEKGLPFYQVELQKPRLFDYSIFHKTNTQHKSIFARMFGK